MKVCGLNIKILEALPVMAFINRMKTAMTKKEFDRVMRELARYRREGGKFDEKVVRFKYWRKAMAVRPTE